MKKIFTLLLPIFLSATAPACTTFFINKNGQMVFGRNYDWVTGNGMVCTNQKGLSKTSSKTKDGETISWVSAYGSITFNQYGKEFPTGGMNEKGLVVELMWLEGTQYPAPDERPAVDVLQWIQYHLDNCGTVEELIAEDNKVRIASSGSTPLHYLVADATGNAAVIEFLEGKMKVHKGKDLPFAVLTNDSYASSLEQTTTAVTSVGGNSVPFTSNSIDRFAKACSAVKQFQQAGITTPVIDYSFTILDNVAQGAHTKWSIVYDITNKKIYFKTPSFPSVKSVVFSAFDFGCAAGSKAFDMNQPGKADISKSFRDFTLDMNQHLVDRSFDESSSQFTVSKEGRIETGQYPAGISCARAAR